MKCPPFSTSEKRTHLDADFFKKNYQLTHVIDRLHAVTLAQVGMGISVADVGADESHAHLRNFHARVIEAVALTPSGLFWSIWRSGMRCRTDRLTGAGQAYFRFEHWKPSIGWNCLEIVSVEISVAF
jgi:hypothetical protein